MPTPRKMSFFQGCCSADAGAWLDANGKFGTAMDDATFAVGVRLRLQDPSLENHPSLRNKGCKNRCKVRGKSVLHSIDHMFLCDLSAGKRTAVHDAVRDELLRFLAPAVSTRSGKVKVTKEPFMVADLSFQRRPGASAAAHQADVAVTSTNRDGKVEKIVIDVTGTYAGAGWGEGSSIDILGGPMPAPGADARHAADRKIKHYDDNYLNTKSSVVPLAFETGVMYSEEAHTRLALASFDPSRGRVPSFSSLRRQLAERLAVTVQTGNARIIQSYWGRHVSIPGAVGA